MKTIYLLCIISSFINGVFGDEVKSVSVMEGDSVTLHTDTKLESNDFIVWMFKDVNDPIAILDRADHTISYNGIFRDRLKLSTQTGDLTIINISTENSGVYQLEIRRKNVITKKFNLTGVSNPESDQLKSVLVKDGDSVTLLADVPDIKKYDEILWRFQGIRIAHFNKSVSEISEDKKFKDKLQPDVQTGSLKIKNIRTDLSGLYEVEISSTSSSYTIHQSFTVTVSGEVKSVSVKKGDPVTINTDVPDIKTYYQILLIFGCDDRIAEANKQNEQFTLEKRFRERMKLNDQTGDFTIKDIRNEDAGDYELKMSSSRRTIQRRFRVNVGLSPADIARIAVGICIGIPVTILLLIAAAAAGVVIYYCLKDKTQEGDEGKSVDLKAEVTDVQRVDLIEWRFKPGEPTSKIWEMFIAAMKRVLGLFSLNETLIAKINPANNIFRTYDGDDDLFRGKLDLNDQTGDLTINDIRQKHTGVYTLKIIRGGKTTEKRFNVFVRGETKILEVDEWKSVDLKTEVKDIKRDDVIEWRFRETLIAEINCAKNIFSTYDGDRFKDKLKLNDQTGDLNINDFREEHTGVFTLKIIRDGKTSYKRFRLFIIYETKTLKVNEEESVDLKTEVKDIKTGDLIEWRFGETLIAEISSAKNIFRTYNGDDDLFRDKLKLNHQTGDLNIKDISEEHDGVYTLKIIRDGKTSYRRFRVFVKGTTKILEVDEGKSADLKTEVKDLQRVEKIEWRFEETLIAEINPAHNIFRTSDKGLFRDKLKLNHQTGDLTISDIKREHGGVYKLKIIRDGETSDRKFDVRVICETKTLEVDEGESADLKTEVKDIKRVEKIEWRFKETLIAKINPVNETFSTYDDDDNIFRDKLTLNHQTGDLNISDIRWKHTGLYKLKIIRGGKTSYKTISVFVKCDVETLRVDEWKSADLKTEVKDLQRVDLIEWRFGETLIAEINPANNIFRTYDDDDDLFRDKLKLNPQTGDLKINYIREKHTGDYTLKIIKGEEVSYRRFRVHVRNKMEPFSVYEGESFNLETKLKDMQGYDVIEWRFGETLIAKINPANKLFNTYDDDDLFRNKLKLNDQTGDLIINDIREKHSGVYTLRRITYGVPPFPQRYFVLVKERKRGQHSEEKRGKDLEQKKGKNSVRKRGGDSVEIEMPLLPNSSQ